jgi:hypothetical protein
MIAPPKESVSLVPLGSDRGSNNREGIVSSYGVKATRWTARLYLGGDQTGRDRALATVRHPSPLQAAQPWRPDHPMTDRTTTALADLRQRLESLGRRL